MAACGTWIFGLPPLGLEEGKSRPSMRNSLLLDLTQESMGLEDLFVFVGCLLHILNLFLHLHELLLLPVMNFDFLPLLLQRVCQHLYFQTTL